ncbi:MAG: ABC transporter ATP-binding protein [Planctomycetota bacterium]
MTAPGHPEHPALRRTLLRLMALGLRHKPALALMVLSMAFLGAVNALLTIAFKHILAFFGSSGLGEGPSEAGMAIIADLHQTAWWVLIMALPTALAAWASLYSSMWVANRCMQDLRQDAIAKLLALDMASQSRLAQGDLIQRMSGDMERTQRLLATLYGKVQQRPWEIAGMLVVLFWYEWRLATAIYLVLIPIGLLLRRLFGRVQRRSIKARESMSHMLIAFEQIAAGFRVIKSMGTTGREEERFADANRELFRRSMKVSRSRSQADGITYGVLPVIMGVLLLAGPWLATSAEVSPAVLGVFLAVMLRKLQLLRTLQRAWTSILDSSPCAARIFDLLDRQADVADRPDAQPCPDPPREAISIERVTFAYGPDEEPVLRDCSLHIPIGATVAFVGESGVGKSTLMDLLMRLYDVQAGAIRIDGMDLRDMRHESLLRQFAVVQQDSFLFDDTVYNNIAYGRPEADRGAVEAAARRAHIHDAILALEGGLGYDTPVGDRGSRLSGGQRQRIAIARALLRDAPVLLLDEPTSALDAESEEHVQAALQELLQGRTAIVVAHRLSTIQHADTIFVFDRAARRVIESGSHQELLERGGHYARLVRLQQLATG